MPNAYLVSGEGGRGVLPPFCTPLTVFLFFIFLRSYGQFVLVLCISNLYSLFFPSLQLPNIVRIPDMTCPKSYFWNFQTIFLSLQKTSRVCSFFLTNIMDLKRYTPRKTIFQHHYQEEFQELIIMFCTFCSREAPLLTCLFSLRHSITRSFSQ